MLLKLLHFRANEDGAITVDWVVLSAAVVGILAVGYGFMQEGAVGLANGTSDYMSTENPGEF